MKNMKQLLKNLMVEESGQDLIEYALVAALVGLGAVAAVALATLWLGVPETLQKYSETDAGLHASDLSEKLSA